MKGLKKISLNIFKRLLKPECDSWQHTSPTTLIFPQTVNPDVFIFIAFFKYLEQSDKRELVQMYYDNEGLVR